MEELKNILNDLIELRDNLTLNFSDEILFEQAVDIFISDNIEKNKSKNITYNKFKEEPATDSQKNLIKKINKGIIPAGITKKDASIFIHKLKDGKWQ